jgi:hypothetical protein
MLQERGSFPIHYSQRHQRLIAACLSPYGNAFVPQQRVKQRCNNEAQ